ncbi:MAG TPA: MFS transporter [Candidatus Eremiobacteraceae bacterium]|nr:MFS transporter [Candidatus Eremiobacteraceae bacterium]
MLSRGVRDQSLLNAYWIPLNFQGAALLAIAVPAALLKFQTASGHTQQLAILASIVAAISIFVPPPVGALSDYLRRRGGHRRPFILAGTVLNAVALVWLAYSGTLWSFTAALFVAVVGQSISTAAYQALIPEVVPREDWGTSAGYQGVASLVGAVGGLAVASLTTPEQTFLWTALVVALGGVTVALTPEGRYVEPDHVHVSDWHNFSVVFASRFLTNTGLTLLSTFVLYFFRDVEKVENPSVSTGLFGVLALAGAIVTAFWTGTLSDRVPRKYVLAAAGIPMALAGLGFAIAPQQRYLIVYALCFGLGYGAFLAVGWALAIDSVPQMRDVARDLGIWGIASGLPSVVAPIAGGWLIAHYLSPLAGYKMLFLLAGLTFVLGSVVVLWVKPRPVPAVADRAVDLIRPPS